MQIPSHRDFKPLTTGIHEERPFYKVGPILSTLSNGGLPKQASDE